MGGVFIAVISVIVALWFLIRVRQPFQTGIAWPFVILGVIFFVICLSVALRSDADLARVTSMIESDRAGLATKELPRMAAVMRNFTVIISIEVLFLVASISTLLFMNLSVHTKGVMTGLLMQASWLFIFDMFARSRGADYYNYLRSVVDL